MTMKELLKQVMKNGDKNIEMTEDGITKAAQILGISMDDIHEALSDFKGLPLDEDDLNEIAGGMSLDYEARKNPAGISF